MKNTCKHEWVEDELFASGAVTMVTGTPNELGQETVVECKKCRQRAYVPKDVFNKWKLSDMH